MGKITLAFYIMSVLMVVVGVPFTVFYYEGADDNDESDEKKLGAASTAEKESNVYLVQRSNASQIGYALKWLIPTLIFAGAIVGVMYWQVGYADIPTTRVTGKFTEGFDLTFDLLCISERWDRIGISFSICHGINLLQSAKCKLAITIHGSRGSSTSWQWYHSLAGSSFRSLGELA
ncbi:hypothetical protein DFJ73DRAFT_258035 [Zopfochytrium polystomum]|nr:hypothetical protein DFJ73DRAFT_258035 [Zopfochytrium polystomum]